uniref:Putative ATPase domain containing protein n=1 Tax=viral metagenome TaxID=1070528 RepID=A0A6M3ILP4_9ZZZZ
MIERIFARNFKGMSFDADLGQYNLFLGPNGSGKTGRIQALTLAVKGYLPTDQKKQPGAIFATHGDGKTEMIVAFKSDKGGRFARKYLPGENGVSCSCSLNGVAVATKQVDRVILDLGDPKIFDLHEFNELSEQKKIDFLLRLSPPGKELGQIDLDLAAAEEKANRLAAEIRGKKLVIEQLTEAKSGIHLPSGSLAEIQKEISTKETELTQAESELKEAEMDRQKQEAENRRIAELALQKKKADEDRVQEVLEAQVKAKEEVREEVKEDLDDLFKRAEQAEKDLKAIREEAGRNEKAFQENMQKASDRYALELGTGTDYREAVLESLGKIRKAMESAGCGACAASLILKMEMGKFKVKGA